LDYNSLHRPQPLGILPFPQGLFLWPKEAAETLLGGGGTDLQPPLDDSALGRFNRFVQAPETDALKALKGELPENYHLLLDLAAFAGGVLAEPPELEGEEEIKGLACLVRASWHLEQDDPGKARQGLEDGLEACREASPLLAAQILNTMAELEEGPHRIQRYRQALDLCPERSLVAAELWLNLGICYQELAGPGQRSALVEAVACYQRSLQFLTREDHPASYALAQNNLALAYLSMPMTEASDQLRMGIAVQALREVLKVYTKENAPGPWASAKMNLANSLQYLPSAHPEQNLAEAVDIYEEILPLRDPQRDPLGTARLLANQANALAHLGVFEHAREKFALSRECFLKGGDNESAQAVEEQIQALPTEKEKPLGAL
jgi:tetratricopeptide (TPR) repeat protein